MRIRVGLGRLRHIGAVVFLCCSVAVAQTKPAQQPPAPVPPLQAPQAKLPDLPPPSPFVTLYRELRSVGLDPARTYHIREVVIDREDLHIYLNDGTISFTTAVNGRITGAFFRGDGEMLLRPPDAVERQSLGLFTKLGVLSERFDAAYFRFNDDTARQMSSGLSATEEAAQFVTENGDLARSLATMDALRLLASMTSDPAQLGAPDRFLHARFATRLGNFDVFYDSLAFEQILVGGLNTTRPEPWYDLWMSFSGRQVRSMTEEQRRNRVVEPWRSPTSVGITNVRVDARLLPPETIEATADLQMKVKTGGQRVLFFELSRYLQVRSVSMQGAPLVFIQNEAMSGSDLEKRGNDLLTVVFPRTLSPGDTLNLRFLYAGRVMEQAGTGLLYVGSRGTWYPNRGYAMSQFDLRFRWPSTWTLVATGHRVALDKVGDELVGVWRSEGLIPLAGFNLGQFVRTSARAGTVAVEAFATGTVEQALTRPQPVQRVPGVLGPARDTDVLIVMPPDKLDPSQGGSNVATSTARAVERFSTWFGPYPYSNLSVTQFPDTLSQGWPTLIFMSSAAFLSEQEKTRLKMSPFQRVLYGELMHAHEAAHQWWGDLVAWRSYRDQWIMEALANYCALMLLEEKTPESVKLVLEEYRQQLLRPNAAGQRYAEAGPVTLGHRLSSSAFPDGYIVVSYGRGTWMLHMLRSIFRDAEPQTQKGVADADRRFLTALRNLRDNFARREITLADVQRAFEQQMPQAAGYEGRRSLAWFFDGWVNSTAIPRITISDVKTSSRGGRPVASFTLLQENCPTDLVTSVPIYAEAADKSLALAGRVFADGRETKLQINVPSGTNRLVVDPHDTILTSR